MYPSLIMRGLLLVAVVFLGAACEGAGPFGAAETSGDPSGFGPPADPSSGAAAGKVVGRVESVDPSTGTLTLSGNVRVRLTTSTTIDKGGDFTSLIAVLASIQAGTPVLCEADGVLDAGVLIAQKLRFVKDGMCDECDPNESRPSNEDPSTEMGGHVKNVDPEAKSFRVVGDVKVQVEAGTVFESDSGCGCKNLEGVAKALEAGLTIHAEVRGRFEDGVLLASEVRFEAVRAREGDEDGQDGQKDVVAGIVASVDLLAGTCRTTDGKLIRITSDSVIDLAGDIHTLADVALRLTLGIRVGVEGEGKQTASGLVASRVKFELDP